MKKIKGFTLAEVLVTVGIIGIVAAITLPLINRFSPDATKVQYLKTYDMLVKTMNEIANNRIYYPETSSNNFNYNYIEYPLVNTSKITINKKDISAGNNKIARVFSDYTGLACTSCESNNYVSSYPGSPMFTTKDNVGIYITTYKEQKTEGIGSNNIFILTNNFVYKTDIYADIDGTVFKFILTADGKVQPADDIGNKYLETRNSWKNINYSKINIKNNYTPETEFTLTKISDAQTIEIPELGTVVPSGGYGGGGNGSGCGGGGTDTGKPGDKYDGSIDERYTQCSACLTPPGSNTHHCEYRGTLGYVCVQTLKGQGGGVSTEEVLKYNP